MAIRSHRLVGAIIAALILITDQFSKQVMLKFFKYDFSYPTYKIKTVNPYFDLVLAWNKGVSFSLFNNYGDAGRYALTVLTCLICIILIRWLMRSDNIYLSLGIGMVLGGAIGNIIDRIKYGAVIDFLHLHYDKFSWPAFNFADTFICIGVPFMILENYVKPKGTSYENK